MHSEKNKKHLHRGIIALILTLVFLLLFVIPVIKIPLTDGGTECYQPITCVYQYEKLHRLTGYSDPEGYKVYLGGSKLYIFGMKVYENTYYVSVKTGKKVEEEDLCPMKHNDRIDELTKLEKIDS